MKILAIEKELKNVDWASQKELLKTESRVVYNLYHEGTIREIYFNESKNAILILECESLGIAEKLLKTLPLVKAGLISFYLMQLNPYTGFDRIMKNE